MAKPKSSLAKSATAKQFDSRGVLANDPRHPSSIREDGTTKGQGFFGPLHTPGYDATELSIGDGQPTSRPYTDRGDMLYPSMVPTLTQDELRGVLNDDFTKPVYDKAYEYAKSRLAAGKSPFAGPGEQYPAPGYEEQFSTAYPNAVMSYPDRSVGYQYDDAVDRYRGEPMATTPTGLIYPKQKSRR